MKRLMIGLQAAAVLMLSAQVETRGRQLSADIPQFYIDAPSFSSNDSLLSRVDLYSHVPYEALMFVKNENHFDARYEVTFNFLGADNALVLEKSWSQEVRLEDFEQTQSKQAYSLTERSVLIAPGIYTLRCQLRDAESKKVSTIVKKVVAGNYSYRDLSLSDILLVKRVTSEGDRKNIVPNIAGNIGDNSNTFYLFFEVYSPRLNDSIDVRYVVNDVKGNEVASKSQIYRTLSNRAQIIAHFDSVQYPLGAYTVTVSVRSYKDSDTLVPAIKQKAFVVRWSNAPMSVTNLDLAIRQMRYIAKDDEYAKIEKAPDDTEKRRLFEEFWRRRDPNPDTKRNEFMEEYYNRVQYANEHFSNYLEGWRTDMGMVFILLGSPNNVERHPFDIDSKPYEVWAYYDLNRQLVFIDETGFGDYRLLTPIWDILQRLKY